MWAINTVLSTRVYMNLVWLAKKPLLDSTVQDTMTGDAIDIQLDAHSLTNALAGTGRCPRPNDKPTSMPLSKITIALH